MFKTDKENETTMCEPIVTITDMSGETTMCEPNVSITDKSGETTMCEPNVSKIDKLREIIMRKPNAPITDKSGERSIDAPKVPTTDNSRETTMYEPNVSTTDKSGEATMCEPNVSKTDKSGETTMCEPNVPITDKSGERSMCEPKVPITDNSRETTMNEPNVSTTDKTGEATMCEPNVSKTDKSGETTMCEPNVTITDKSGETTMCEPNVPITDKSRETTMYEPNVSITDKSEETTLCEPNVSITGNSEETTMCEQNDPTTGNSEETTMCEQNDPTTDKSGEITMCEPNVSITGKAGEITMSESNVSLPGNSRTIHCESNETLIEEIRKWNVSEPNVCTPVEQREGILCDPCSFDHDEVPAFTFCIDCTEYLCKSCHKEHKKIKMTRNHRVLVGEDVPSSKETFQMLKDLVCCKTHPSKEISYKCLNHNEYICIECESKSHRKCENVEEIHKLSKDDPHGVDLLMKNVGESIDIITNHNKERADNISTLGTDLCIVKDELNKTINEVTDLLIGMKTQLNDSAEQMVKEQVAACNCAIDKGKSLITNYERQKQTVVMAIKYGSPTHVHIATERMREIMLSSGNQLDSLKVADPLKLKFSSNFKQFASLQLGSLDISNLTSTAAVETSTLSDTDLGSDAVLEEQEKATPSTYALKGEAIIQDKLVTGATALKPPKVLGKPLRYCSLEHDGIYSIHQTRNEYPSNIYGITCVGDKIVLIDRDNFLLTMLDQSYRITAQEKLESEPLGLCAMDNHTVMLTLRSRRVQRYRVTNEGFEFLSQFDVKLNCRGIAKAGEHVAILMSDEDIDKKIYIQCNDSDEVDDLIEVQIRRVHNGHKVKVVDDFVGKSDDSVNLNDPMYLLYTENDHIILGEKNKLSDFDDNNRRQQIFRSNRDHHINGITGLAADDEGNIYVCGWNSNNVYQVSANNFRTNRVVIFGIQKAWAIAFDSMRKRLIVSSENSDFLHVFKFCD